ncbi:MAG: lysophospholipid acyltransferase family protein [Gemmataceae bacterium]
MTNDKRLMTNDQSIRNPSAECFPAPWLADWWYQATYAACATFFTLGYSLRIKGRQRIPREGPVLLMSNHQSYLDPPIVGLAAPRPLCYLARKTLFRKPAFAWLIRSVNAVPIDQQGLGKEGLQAILRLLQGGRAVLVFPEGHRTADGNFLDLQPGIHLLIKRAKVPVVPVGVAGGFAAWPRQRKWPRLAPLFLPPNDATLAVWVGQPLDGARLAAQPREQVLAELLGQMRHAYAQAERLRRR